MVTTNKPMKECISCKEEIYSEAINCSNCGSSQTNWLRMVNTVSSPITLAISVTSIFIAMAAFYNSVQKPISNPVVEIQTTGFGATEFTFLVYNVGDAPSIVKWVGLDMSLQQGEGSYILKAGFNLEQPLLLKAGESTEVEISYNSFIPKWTSWEVSVLVPSEGFSTSFLYGAAGMGSNLICDVGVTFTRSNYYNYNSISNAKTNGNCVKALEWFAKAVGPLKFKN